MRLALSLGMTVEQLLTGKPAPLSQDERIYWLAFHALEPFDRNRLNDYLQTGTLTAAVYNAHRTKGKALDAEDIFPALKRRPRGAGGNFAENIEAFKFLAGLR